MASTDVLYLVVPCYNEEQVLPETNRRLTGQLAQWITQGQISEHSRILYVNDGSSDRTWALIRQCHEESPFVSGLCLSRNRGHQNALLAGLSVAAKEADIAISLDADLQDDIGVLTEFLSAYQKGADIVYGVRKSRKSDTFFKKTSALLFYRMLRVFGVELVYNHADYRLMSKRALSALMEFKEVNLFLRGLVPLVGFPSAVVPYERQERFAGRSKYPLGKMLGFAWDGITSFSIKPLRFITAIGIAIFSVSLLMLLYFLVSYWSGHTVQGWTSIVISVWAIGGLQLLGIGILGEYIGKIYLETKGRPRFFIDTYLHTPAPPPRQEP